jgi:hypothetical protein
MESERGGTGYIMTSPSRGRQSATGKSPQYKRLEEGAEGQWLIGLNAQSYIVRDSL